MKRGLLLISLLALMASCSKDDGGSGHEEQTQEFTLMLPSVKTSISGQNAFWDKGDKAAFFSGSESMSAVFTSENTSSSARAVFKCKDSKAIKAGGYYMAVSPASALKQWDGKEMKAIIGIPSSQKVTSAGWDSGAAVFATAGAGTNLMMNPMCSFVKFTIDAKSAKANRLVVNGSAPLTGEASVSMSRGNASFVSCLDDSRNTATLQTTATVFANGVYFLAVMPGTHPDGVTFSFINKSGDVVYEKKIPDMEFPAGKTISLGTIPSSQDARCRLIASGAGKVYVFDKDNVKWGEEYTKGLVWSWSSASLGDKYKKADIADAVPVDNGKGILVTGAYTSYHQGFCVYLKPNFDTTDGVEQVFFTSNVYNAHSAELLPGNYIVVACSNGDNHLKMFNLNSSTPDAVIGSYPLESAHGVEWCEQAKRLYAIGGTSLQIYTFDKNTGALALEKTISTSSYVSHLHSLSLCEDDNTLVIGGNNVATYDIAKGSFKNLVWFNDSYTNGIKSVNMNSSTKEVFYTFAAKGTAEGSTDTHTHTIRYCDDPSQTYNLDAEKHIKVTDIEMYKVRVLSW